ncbi:MAG: divalent-cation tolerance protein CutA [Planctomycetota bacterium]|nr:MAG: divalent-cation tolerance protein CutA [Planctomycetota bacterium]
MDDSLCTIYVTAGSREEALRIARSLVEEKLVACVNVFGDVVSVYRWRGACHEDPEVVLIAKTTAERRDAAMLRIVALHSYDCPCVTSWPILAAHEDYEQWVRESVRE